MIGVTDLFFKRAKKERGELPDIYQYDKLPEKLKIQIVHIWKGSIGEDYSNIYDSSDNIKYYENVYNILCKELGVFQLGVGNTYFQQIGNYFLKDDDVEISLSIIELMMWCIDAYYKNKYYSKDDFQKIIDELNERFKENGIGYQYENKKIIRIDSQYLHTEAVKPALTLLGNPIYQGAQQEFLNAHEHYRHQRYQEAMIDCLKAYESTLKIILKKRKWEYKDTDTADALTGKIMQKGLIPDYWQQYFKSLKNTLTSGVPTARNKEAGHGQADEIRNIPDYLASYILHITASAIVFLIKAEEAL
nr:hypothetical protein [uncultured Neisseria sp.]